jgi:alanine-glyoxylate transaminase / serine-glyoxylate transaminase / serine-pyruvate transaminase
MAKPIAALAPPARLLCGPGPTNVEPAALAAMGKPMLGHLDPAFHAILDEVVAMLAEVYRAHDGLVLPLQSTGTSGMETGIVNLVEPGDTVVVGVSGYFGARIAEIARRHGANVVEVAEEWGRHVPNERLVDALERNPGARLVAVVHGETSTGVEHPLAELGEAVRGTGALVMADCVTTLGGVRIDFDAWGVDYAYSCTQKCLGAPPGMSPLALSPRALDRIETRTRPVPFSLDLRLLRSYFVDRPAAYHHTAPILHVYALHEVLRQTLEEGVEQRWRRHEAAGRHFAARAEEAGLEVLAEAGHRLAPLTAVRVPEGIDGKDVQRQLLAERGLEVGGGLGAATPPIWRVGLMGPNASESTADEVLTALTAVLEGARVPVAG